MSTQHMNCKMKAYSIEEDSNLMKVSLIVMHEDDNYNGSNFPFSSMLDAEETIKNTPILGYTVRDGETGELEDFDGHNMETRIVDGDNGFSIETRYIERPIGLIPENCNPRYEEIEGCRHFIVDGYIWKSYSNGAYKLISENEFKGVSMEIEVLDGQMKRGSNSYIINKYRYLGVTCLGDHVPPAMGDTCKITKYSSDNFMYKKIVEDIYKEIYRIEERKEEDIVEKELEFEESIKKLDDDNVVITEEEITPEETEKLSHESEAEEEVTETVEEPTEEPTEEATEEFGVDEEVEETEEDFKKKRKCSTDDEEFSLEKFNSILETVPNTLEEVYSAIVEKFNSLTEELKTLRDFKNEVDKNELHNSVEEILSEFSFEESEIEDVKMSALNGDISLKDFKKELFAIEGEKLHLNKKKFSKDETAPSKVKINVVAETTENEPYGGLFSRYKK